MCDYSLMAIPNRLAVSGEELVVHRFGQGSVGLAAPCDLQRRQEYRKVRSHGFWPRLKEVFDPPMAPPIPAVCIPPGARLLIRDIPEKLQQECGLHKDLEEAVFTQITAAVNTYRDALRFQNGIEVLLQRFAVGKRARVLNLSSAEEQATEPMEPQRVRV